MHWIYLIHKFHNLSWITEINELFHDILIYWDAPVRGCKPRFWVFSVLLSLIIKSKFWHQNPKTLRMIPHSTGRSHHSCGLFFNFVGWRDPTKVIFTPREHDWASFGLVLRSNWVDFVVKTCEPHSYCSLVHADQFRTMIGSHWKADIGHI